MVIIEAPTYRILVDADACPVKREIINTAAAHKVQVLMVASFDHRLEAESGVQVIQVDRSSQSVDIYIANALQAGDILVTQDFGLAAIGLGKRAMVLSNRGEIYTDENIDYLLARRHESAKIRRGGGRTKGPRALTSEDRNLFLQTLTKVLVERQE